ncbi:MAG TPA: protein kinase, partial [Terriglobales bacterium]|nr:protein kinase [Terriglobales bacterium]
REVAIKILPAHFARDAERLRRFEQEARAAAALNHPNILAIYDLGTQPNGSPFIVSELLDGESLRDKVRSGPLPLRKATDYAAQIARGLAAAHDKGIVHRDLKPENLFVTKDGRAKILDFGLAKLTEKTVSDVVSSAPTEAAGTTPGMVLGTVGYMSPEQVRGLEADHRSDIFSFGAILYEMLSGKRCFRGDTTADTMSAILKDDPPELTETNRQVPPALERIVGHCLEKNPDERFQSARDVAFNLDALSGASTATATAAAAPARSAIGKLSPSRRRAFFATVGSLGLLIALALGMWTGARLAPPAAPQFHQLTFRHGLLGDARFTPDGQDVIYTASWEGSSPEIFSVSTKDSGGRPVEIRNAILLSVSRKGELAVMLSPRPLSAWTSFGALARVPVSGGAPKPEIDNVVSADWTPDGTGLAIVRWLPDQRVCQLEYPIGTPLYKDGWLGDLRFSHDGRYLAFADHATAGDDMGSVIVLGTDGKQVLKSPPQTSLQGLAWTPNDREVWVTSPVSSGSIFAYTLSGKSRELLKVPGRTQIHDIASDGRVLAIQGTQHLGFGVITADGKTERDLSWLDWPLLRRIRADGQKVLFEEEGNAVGEHYTAFLRDIDGSPAVALGEGYGAGISRDGNWALGQIVTRTPRELWLLPTGAGEPRRLSPPTLDTIPLVTDFTADSKSVVYAALEANHQPRTYLQSLDGGAPRAVTPEGVAGSLLSSDQKYLVVRSSPVAPPQLFEMSSSQPSRWRDGRKATN